MTGMLSWMATCLWGKTGQEGEVVELLYVREQLEYIGLSLRMDENIVYWVILVGG